jgi:hypothetical protein
MNEKSPLRRAFKMVAVVLPACVAPVAMGQANAPADSAHATALQACPKVSQEIVDLNVLADGLKNSNAVGLFEKVRLKSAIDELIGRMKAFHGGARSYTLAQLQEQYDVLMMRIASQLQDKDLALHGRLCNAWETVWSQLADRSRFMATFS